MTEYEFKKLESNNVTFNFYTCNYHGSRTLEGKYYKKEDVICLFTEFLNTFSPIEKSIIEMKKFIHEEFEIYTKEINNQQ